jgi:hypothetical protein
MSTTIISDHPVNGLETPVAATERLIEPDFIAPYPASAFEGPFLDSRDIIALVGVAIITLGPLAALPLGF